MAKRVYYWITDAGKQELIKARYWELREMGLPDRIAAGVLWQRYTYLSHRSREPDHY